jgi:Holliday junction resolvase RusA-like endonuclease
MSLAVYLTVDGPAVGKGRPRVSTIAGRPRMYTPAKTAAWERLVAEAARSAMGSQPPSSHPWSVRIVIVAQIPVSWSKRRQEAAARGDEVPGKPDLDNVAKAVLDACNGIVYADDKQVTRLVVEKHYGTTVQTEVYAHEVLR